MGWGNKSLLKCTWSHDPRWPPCPCMVKTLKNLLLWNQTADDPESRYVALGTRVLPNCSNDDLG